MRIFLALVLAASLAALAISNAQAQRLDVPIMLAPTDGQMAGCGGARVRGLNPNGDGFLAVRTGPSTGYRKIAELYNGDWVNTCDSEGAWYGVVYGREECGVHDARPRTMAYRGPCRTGWVHGRYLTDPIP